jgi:hypothetical protein
MLDEPGHLLGCDTISSDYQIAFILSIFIIEDDDEFTLAERLQRLLDAGEARIGRHISAF